MKIWLCVCLCLCASAVRSETFDVVIYGATASGVAAAIAASSEGMATALAEPGRHVGGMVSGGLSHTDVVNQEHLIGGLAREFFVRAGRHYGKPIAFDLEPKIAEQIMRDWLRDAKVRVYHDRRLNGVEKVRDSLASIRMDDGSIFSGRVFIDATYEGDLMKAAGVSYRVGRESRSLYNESLAGRQEFRPDSHQFLKPVSPFDERGKLLPYIVRQEDLVATGEGDDKIQSYCFRVCLTDVEANRIPFSPPANYDARRYGLVRNYLERAGRELTRRQFFGLSALPNGKYDLNSGGAVSTNLPGAAWEYPEATYRRRQEIWREHLSWTQGLLYFLSHDPTSPETLRTEINRLGLPRDEFIDNEHWPTQLYIREARRMLGEYVLTQHDLQKYRRKYDSIGMGGYNIDIREVQWIAFKVFHFPRVQDEVISEGYVSMPVDPYEIPYRSLLPRQQECDNLLVPVCISASQVAYGSFRMEPQFMIAGHCAGTAAALAIRAGVALHRIDIGLLQQKLRAQDQVLSLEEAPRSVRHAVSP